MRVSENLRLACFVINFRHGITRNYADFFKLIRDFPRNPCLKETGSRVFGQAVLVHLHMLLSF